MKAFLDQDFLLQSPTAQKLYHQYAAEMPIIDYHNHLNLSKLLMIINLKISHRHGCMATIIMAGDAGAWGG